jgi:FKBP-type peptidyl-prolyl cis-trans isomerase
MRLLISIVLTIVSLQTNAFVNSFSNSIDDSIKAVSYLAHITVQELTVKKEITTGIKADDVQLYLEADKKDREVVFEFPATATVVATGVDVTSEKGELTWQFQWNMNEPYKLLIATATDSVLNFMIYSGYIYFPNQNKWKLIASCKIQGRWGSIKNTSTFKTNSVKDVFKVDFSQTWLQRNNGSWKNMEATSLPSPVINPMSSVDSLIQSENENQLIQKQIAENKTDAVNAFEGVYYTILKEGTGPQVKVTDTVTVFYKGYLLTDGSVFDQTKEKPATFPLNRLIKGWQIGVPLCKVGGKIKIIIPSGIGYSIRTRAAKIPPNSILVFEVEVVSVK